MSKPGTNFTIKPVRAINETSVPIVAVTAAASCFHVAYSNGELARVFPEQDSNKQVDKIKFSNPPTTTSLMSSFGASSLVKVDIACLFTSASAYHTLVGSSAGEVYHLTLDSSQAVCVSKLSGNVVTAVWWIDEVVQGAAELIVGTQSGKLFQVTLEHKKETILKQIGEISSDRIVDIIFFAQTSQLLVSTASAVYLFAGLSAGKPALIFESPEPCINCKLIISGSKNLNVSWLSGVAVVTFNLPSASVQAVVPHSVTLGVQSASLVSKKNSGFSVKPRGLAVTDLHYIVQFEARIVLVSRISLLPVASATTSAYSPLFSSSSSKLVFAFSEWKVFQISIGNEALDAWKHWLKRRKYPAALAATSVKAERAFILKHEADFLLDSSDLASTRAADLYAQAMKEDYFFIETYFNEIVARLEKVDKGALLQFLAARMDLSFASSEDSEQREVVQMSVLFIYCVNLFVDRLMEQDIRSEFYSFVELRHASLDRQCIETMFELLESVGLFQELVHVAHLVGDQETAVRIDLELGNYEAIIKRFSSNRGILDEELVLKLSPLLFRFCPEEFCAFLLENSKSLSIAKFVPALASCGALTRLHKDQAVLVLSHALEPNKELTNLLIQVSCEIGSDESVAHLIESVHSTAFFDPEFALRCIKHFGFQKAEAVFLSVTGLDLEATKLALKIDQDDIAFSCAYRSAKVETRRVCWLEILRNFAARTDASAEKLIKVFRDSEVLEITDLLPLIGNVDLVQKEIREQVEAIQAKGQATRAEISNYQDALKLIRSDMVTKSNECVILGHSQKCDICFKLVFSEKFIAFNCGHCFHQECAKEALAKRINAIPEKSCCLCGSESLLLDQLFEPFVDPALDSAAIAAWSIVSH